MNKQNAAIGVLIVLVIILGGATIYLATKEYPVKTPSTRVTTPTVTPTPTTTQAPTLTQPAAPTEQTNEQLFELSKKEPGTKLYISEKLGVGFTYDPTSTEVPAPSSDVIVTEKNNKIYIHYVTQKPEDGQSVEVFTIEPATSIAEAITKKFLQGIDKKDCSVVTDVAPSQGVAGYVSAMIDYPPVPDKPIEIPEPCPQNFSKTNGIRYFLMNTNVPNKLLFVSIGQYVLTSDGTPKNPTTGLGGHDWAHAIRVLK